MAPQSKLNETFPSKREKSEFTGGVRKCEGKINCTDAVLKPLIWHTTC